MTPSLRTELTEQFKAEVHDQITVDVEDAFMDEDFKSLTVGWALAKGLSCEDALEFGSYIRYETDLG